MSPHCSSDLGLPEMCLSPDLDSSPCGSLSPGHLWPQGHKRGRCSANGVGGTSVHRGPRSPTGAHPGQKQLGPRGPRARKAFPDVTPHPRLLQDGPRGEGAASSLAQPLSAGHPVPSGSWPTAGSLFPAHCPFSNRHVCMLDQPAFGCSDQCTKPLKGCPSHVEAVDTGSHLGCSPGLSLMVKVGRVQSRKREKRG